MYELPFVVVHGAVIWKVILVAFVALISALLVLLRKRNARVSAEELAESRIAASCALVPGNVTLRARLRGGRMVVFQRRGARHAVFDQVWLDHAGIRVDIAGTLELIGGSTTSVVTAPKELGGSGRAVRTELADGDEITVEGWAVHDLDAKTWTIEPAQRRPLWWTGDVPVIRAPTVTISAVSARGAVTRPSAIATCVAGLTIALLGYGTLWLIGSRAFDSFRKSNARWSDFNTSLTIAFAMPGSRDEALDGLRSRFAESDTTSERIFQLRLELDDAFGSCADKVKTLDDMNELDEALALATVCGLSDSRTDLLDRTGRYTEELVSGRQDWLDHRAFAAIAIGNWQVAAETAAALAAQERDEAWKVTFNCAAEWFRTKAGDATASARLQALAASTADVDCKLIATLVLPADQQLAAIDAIAWPDYGGRFDLARTLVFVDDPERDDDRGIVPHRTEWVARWARDDVGTPQHRINAEYRYATTAAYLADPGKVQHTLATATAAYPAGSFEQENAYSNELVLWLHTNALTPPPIGLDGHDMPDRLNPWVEDEVALRLGRKPGDLSLEGGGDCKIDVHSVVRAAQSGDGGPLVRLLDECGVYWHQTDEILAVLPRITTARDALSRRLRLLHPLYETDRFELLAADLEHRDLAALSGDPTTAAKWQAIIDRKVAALADKDRAIATSLWSSFFR